MKFHWFAFKRSSIVYPLWFLIGFSALLFSCDPQGDEIESLVQPNPDDFLVLFSDTSTVQLSTVVTDSVMTGSTSRLLVGRYADPYFGKMQTAAFIQPTLSGSVNLPDLAEFDSLTLSLNYDLYTYGDTTKPLNLTVHKLLADMLEKNGAYYNENSTPFEETPLAKIRVVPSPRTRNRLTIRLSDALGKDIFAKGKENLLTSNTEWINLVKGLVVKSAATDNGAVVGFTIDSTRIQMHYHVAEVNGVRRDSTLFRTTAAYNQILADRAGTLLSGVSRNQRVATPTAQTGNKAFVQAGMGVMTRIDLPTVRQLRSIKYTASNRAFLRITPAHLSVTDQLNAPPVLYVYRVNKNNEFYLGSEGFPLPLFTLATSGSSSTMSSSIYQNDFVNNRRFYLLDISAYVTELLTSETGDVGGLVIRTSPFNTRSSTTFPAADSEFTKSLHRLVFGDQQSSDPGIKLELYYTVVKVK